MKNKCKILPYSKSTRKNHIDHRIRLDNIANTLSCGEGGSSQSTCNFIKEEKTNGKVRLRTLTPTETEKLMGWPKNWTKFGIDASGKKYEIPEGARYRATGNGIVSTVPKTILEKLLKDEDQLKVMSTFSGVDGSTLLLDKKKFKKIGFAEFDPEKKKQHSSNILKYRYPKIRNFGDITKIDPTEIEPFDLMFASSPCQTFSSAGKRAGFSDTKGTLFEHVINLLESHKECKYLFFENVKGLVDHDNGNTFLTILRAFSKAGFEVDFEICNSKHFGIPQARERVYLFGRRLDDNLQTKVNSELSNPKDVKTNLQVIRMKERIRTEFQNEINLKDFNIPLSNKSNTKPIEKLLDKDVSKEYYIKDHYVVDVLKDGIFIEDRIVMKTDKETKVPKPLSVKNSFSLFLADIRAKENQ